MKSIIKKIIKILPRSIKILIFRIYEISGNKKVYKYYSYSNSKKPTEIKNILFYHKSGLSFGGTEKFLQIIAKHINKEKYKIYYAYSSISDLRHGHNKIDGRKYYLENQKIELIDFSFSKKQDKYPYILEDTSPSFYQILEDKNINLIITAGSGYSEFPFNIVRDTPIIMLNIFGSPSAQKNIIEHVCISKEVQSKILPVVPKNKTSVMYIPSEPPAFKIEKINKIKERFNIAETDFVFGRIGRASDDIFDPIGIDAFADVVKEYPNSHYLIMSTPPIIKKIVTERNIPNVHFLEASSDEEDVWAFHNTIDVLAHFRNDGESCGLNIIESMLCGNPIITHRSHIWNAHIEYLKNDFAKIADKGDVTAYAKYMVEMIKLKDDTTNWNNTRNNIEKYSRDKFLIANNIEKIEKTIEKYASNIN